MENRRLKNRMVSSGLELRRKKVEIRKRAIRRVVVR